MGWATCLNVDFRKHLRRKQESNDETFPGNKCVRSSGFCREGLVRVGIFHMAPGPGIAGGIGTALIDSLIKELDRL